MSTPMFKAGDRVACIDTATRVVPVNLILGETYTVLQEWDGGSGHRAVKVSSTKGLTESCHADRFRPYGDEDLETDKIKGELARSVKRKKKRDVIFFLRDMVRDLKSRVAELEKENAELRAQVPAKV